MGRIIIFVLLYFIIPPGIFVLIKFIKDRAKYALFGRKRSSTAIKNNTPKEGINRKIIKRIKFTIKDPRKKPLPFKLIFILIYVLGLILSIYAGLQGELGVLFTSVLICYFGVFFSVITANKVVSERDLVLKRMMELKSSKMRLVNREKGAMPNIETEFRVVSWGDDLVNPTKMDIYMPTDFDLLQVDGFMESFNLIFGGNGTWVSDDSEGGFDFNAGVAHIKVSPKLPPIAIWHERYLDPKYIHWSYFPLALGSENGVPLVNEETGETERVLGFAVNSGQEKLSKKNGVNIGREVTSSPQILVAGGT